MDRVLEDIITNVKVKRLDDGAVIPMYAHDGDVCFDIVATSVEYDAEKDLYIYHTGLAMETDAHYGMFLFVRSSNSRTDAYLTNHVGVVDTATYRGEIQFRFKNRDSFATEAETLRSKVFFDAIGNGSGLKEAYDVADTVYLAFLASDPLDRAPYKVGERIGQGVIMPVGISVFKWCQELSETERGEGGFGSTGR